MFFDRWCLTPGRRWIAELDAAIDASKAAVLIVSPEASESGWVKDEYEKLKRRQNARARFPIIPVIHSRVEVELPFVGNVQSVDFRSPSDYRTAFAILLAGLDDVPPGPDPTYDGPLEPPPDDRGLEAPRPQGALEALHQAVLTARTVQVLVRGGVSVSRIALACPHGVVRGQS